MWQHDKENPRNPCSLLVAYEQNGTVLPVASDFDPFLVGSRGLPIVEPLAPKQVEVMHWLVGQLEAVLAAPPQPHSWTSRWLTVLKEASKKGFHPKFRASGSATPHPTP